MGFRFIRNAGTVIRDADFHHRAPSFRTQNDMRAGRRIFDGVVDNVDNHLNDQPDIHPSHQQIVRQFGGNPMLLCLPVDMSKRLLKHIGQELGIHLQMHGAVFNPRNRQQVLRQIDKPHRVIVNRTVQLLLLLFIQRNTLFH